MHDCWLVREVSMMVRQHQGLVGVMRDERMETIVDIRHVNGANSIGQVGGGHSNF